MSAERKLAIIPPRLVGAVRTPEVSARSHEMISALDESTSGEDRFPWRPLLAALVMACGLSALAFQVKPISKSETFKTTLAELSPSEPTAGTPIIAQATLSTGIEIEKKPSPAVSTSKKTIGFEEMREILILQSGKNGGFRYLINHLEGGLEVSLRTELFFAKDSHKLEPGAKKFLRRLVQLSKGVHENTRWEIHTNPGFAIEEKKLSGNRAKAMKKALTQLGVAKRKLTTRANNEQPHRGRIFIQFFRGV